MSTWNVEGTPHHTAGSLPIAGNREQLHREFRHLRSHWVWLLCFGILLALSGTIAIVVPAATMGTTFVAVIMLGMVLMISGIATIITSFWSGQSGGMLLQLLCGILYLVAGYVITDQPKDAAKAMTVFIAIFFVMLGLFRILSSLIVRFPFWGWSLLNGVITFLCGVIIYRHFHSSSLWVIGLLVGLEMLFHGWTWIMLALAIKSIPEEEI